MFTIISLIIISFFVRAKKNVAVYILLYGFSFFSFSIAIDGNFYGFWDYLYIYDKVENSKKIIYYWFVIFFSYTVFFILLSNKINKLSFYNGSLKHIRMYAYIFSVISLIAAIYNFMGAGNLTLMFTNARLWEANFGRNVVFNYLFFLHLLALVLFGILIGLKKGRRLDVFMVILLLFSSIFHGIKFTILHAFLFFYFSYLLTRGEKLSSHTYYFAFFLLSLLLVFFIFIRGGGIEGLLNYIASASINSMYIINNYEFYEISSYKIFNPFTFIPFEKFESRLLSNSLSQQSLVGFLLNDKYNLEHAITKIGFSFGIGFLIYSILFALLINYLRNSTALEFHKIFFLVIILDTILFFFTGFDFYKTKLWFGFFISLLAYYIIIFRKINIKQ